MKTPQFDILETSRGQYTLKCTKTGKTITAPYADDYRRDPVKACRKALRRTADVAENDRLEVINLLLGTHGTEAIRGEWQNGYWCDIVAAYCNTGDTYAVTVIQKRGECSFDNSRFFVSTVGDFVERNSKRLGIA